MDQMIPSIWAPGWFGILFPRMAALPRWSRMLILLHRWEVASVSSWPVWRARAAPSFFTSLLASGCHPPKVSTTIGKKAIPCLLHSSSAPLILRSESEQKFSFMTKPQLSNLQQTVPTRSSSSTVITSKSFESASSHVRVTSIKSTEQEWRSESVSDKGSMIGLGSDNNIQDSFDWTQYLVQSIWIWSMCCRAPDITRSGTTSSSLKENHDHKTNINQPSSEPKWIKLKISCNV